MLRPLLRRKALEKGGHLESSPRKARNSLFNSKNACKAMFSLGEAISSTGEKIGRAHV
jgi:hypothetical protein